ncbi:PAS domain-containing protein [Dongia mobilis]|uniref:PAS domain-containing protein n=1 Tax=Dongia mobilis TaxID=578943 RepID=A0A4R6WQB4_9PROT|nr:PAS domain-containing protein [Dongia mobilis]TDQ83414.1 PAS domain-containing protein [Dongia mobilis]
MIRVASIAELGSEPLSRLESYWLEKRGSRPLPARADLDPADIKDLLPQIILTRIEHDPLRVKYTVVGTASAKAAGFDYTGRYLDELAFDSEVDTDWPAIYRELVREKKPIAGVCQFKLRAVARPYRVAVFPLSSDGVLVDHAISYEHLNLNLLELDQILPVKPRRD